MSKLQTLQMVENLKTYHQRQIAMMREELSKPLGANRNWHNSMREGIAFHEERIKAIDLVTADVELQYA